MRWSLKIGKIAGIGVYIHATFWLLILYVIYANWTQGGSLETTIYSALFVLAVFGCITLHEFGHALTARRFGVETLDITLLPIGGLARLERMPENPVDELWVALAGPAVNVAIAGAIFVALILTGSGLDFGQFAWYSGGFFKSLMIVNAMLVAFNMIPAFPMDGGRVLRALLASRMEFTRATRTAARIGQVVAVIFFVVGLKTNPFLIFIGVFVWAGAQQEAAIPPVHAAVGGVPVHRVMMTEFHTLTPDEPLGPVADLFQAGGQEDFPVVFGDHVLGVANREALAQALAKEGAGARARDAMRRDVPVADSQQSLKQALELFREGKCRSIPVKNEGRLVGLLTLEQVQEFLSAQSAFLRSRRRTVDTKHSSASG